MRTTLLLVMSFLVAVFAESETQTDWSGGGGVPGPVTEWCNTFASADHASWLAIPGQLALSSFPLIEPLMHVVGEDFDGAQCVYSSDLDGDGDVDIIGGAGRCDDVAWWVNLDGSGDNWEKRIIDEGYGDPECVYAIDIDGDGDDDIVGASSWSSEVTWWQNLVGDGSQWLRIPIDLESRHPRAVSAADVDRDDDVDLFCAIEWDYEVVWWENADGGGYVWIKHTVDDYDGVEDVYAVDFDHDGDADVLGGARGERAAWWENVDGYGGSFLKHEVGPYSGPIALDAVDVDWDGDYDVMYTERSHVGWSENIDGQGTDWEHHYIDDDLYEGCAGEAADLDGDGDFDVTAIDQMMNYIAWWENSSGDGLNWCERGVRTSIGAQEVHTTDVDGDGDLDICAAVKVEDRILWFEITAFRPSGELVGSILDTEAAAAWGPLEWIADTPDGTSLTVGVRASDDPQRMGDWSEVPSSGTDLTEIIPDGLRYFQYKVSLSSSDTDVSPIFSEINLEWDEASGIGDVELSASPTREGILIEWNVTGDRPFGFRLLRQSPDTGLIPVHEGCLSGEAVCYLDRGVVPGVEYVYWLEVFEGLMGDEAVDRFGPTEAVSVPEFGSESSLSVYPNPAGDSLTVAFYLPVGGRVELTVYDLAGRRIAELADGEWPIGRNNIVWNCADASPGVYLCVLSTEMGTLSRRFVIAR
ncbi:T9SS type A sorting domain-containing protein [bacterium]|nr:T9SS type A sorting domain-containing protein [bacterium]